MVVVTNVVEVVDVDVVVELVVVGAAVVEALTDVLVVFAPLILVSLQATSNVAEKHPATAITPRIFVRRNFMRQVCQRRGRSTDQGVGFFATFNQLE